MPTKPHAAASSVRPCRVVDRGPGRDRAQIDLLELGIVAVLVPTPLDKYQDRVQEISEL